MLKKILVVGGAGFVGGAVTDLLLKSDHQVRVYDSLLYEESYKKPIEFIYGDIRDHDKLKIQLDWADVVIWLAAIVGDGACDLYPEIARQINEKEVGWLARNFDGRIIFPSTSMVYGVRQETLDEYASLNPLSLYAKTKEAAEKHLQEKNALVFRLGSLFGIGDQVSRIRLDLVANIFIVQAVLKGKLTVFGAEKIRPLLHVRDVARAMVDNIETEHRGIFNLHWKNMRIIDIADQVKNFSPEVLIDVIPEEAKPTGNYRMNSDKAKNILGFQPSYSLDDGINQMKKLIESGRIDDFQNPCYNNEKFLKANPSILTK